MPCSVLVVPHAPCCSYKEFKYVLAHMLPEDVVSLNSLDHIKSGEKKCTTYILKKKKKSHKTPHLGMNLENLVMLCKAWNLTKAYHPVAFCYYINQS